ncbi:hypothetical protein EVA_19328 [gut metagenome]|uniref:Uncharacterized protein n=1 Tax=gut metagenome TaxID=749906 RepID=J9FCH0_9ZZZZ
MESECADSVYLSCQSVTTRLKCRRSQSICRGVGCWNVSSCELRSTVSHLCEIGTRKCESALHT